MCNGYDDEDDNVLNSSIHEPLVQLHTEDQDEPEHDDLTDIQEERLTDPPDTDDGEIGHLQNEDLNGQLLDDESKIHEPLVQVGIEEKSIEMTSLQRKYQKIGHTALLAPTSKILENLNSLNASMDLDKGVHEPLSRVDEKSIEMINLRRQEREQKMNQKALAPTNKILQNLNNLNAKMDLDDNVHEPKVELEEPTAPRIKEELKNEPENEVSEKDGFTDRFPPAGTGDAML